MTVPPWARVDLLEDACLPPDFAHVEVLPGEQEWSRLTRVHIRWAALMFPLLVSAAGTLIHMTFNSKIASRVESKFAVTYMY
jgi:hypothetical protein